MRGEKRGEVEGWRDGRMEEWRGGNGPGRLLRAQGESGINVD